MILKGKNLTDCYVAKRQIRQYFPPSINCTIQYTVTKGSLYTYMIEPYAFHFILFSRRIWCGSQRADGITRWQSHSCGY